MKRIFSVIVAMLAMAGVANAQSDYQMNVITSNGQAIAIDADQIVSVTFSKKPVVIEAATGTDLGTVLADVDMENVPSVTIKLAEGGKYTASAPIEVAVPLTIEGNGATIDASGNSNPFILLSSTPMVDEINTYYRMNNVTIKDVVINDVKNSIFYDNNTKYCVVYFTIDNCVIKLATEAVKNDALISFQGGGAKDFIVKNSTIYGGAKAKYFIRYNNAARLDRYGFDKSKEFQTMDYQNNTFYNLLKEEGQWGNYSGIAGQNYIKYVVKNNIWKDCQKDIVRRMVGGRLGGSAPVEFLNNTYWNAGAANDESNYDKSGTALTTDPAFEDAAQGKFKPTGADQVAKQTGDPRWFK